MFWFHLIIGHFDIMLCSLLTFAFSLYIRAGLGLDKELKKGGKPRISGSLAYIAPEVANGLNHNRLVDAYSFGFLVWEICSLETAFGDRETEDDMHTVWNGDVRHRPPMTAWWPVELQWLIKACWTYTAESRPCFDCIVETLDEILDDEDEEEDSIRGIRSFRFGSGIASDTSAESCDESARGIEPGKCPQQPNAKKFFFGLF
jgi:serine/threonine protein kinase